MKLNIFFANFQILGPLGCQGWVVIPQNVKKSKNHCTLMGNPMPESTLTMPELHLTPSQGFGLRMQGGRFLNEKYLKKPTLFLMLVLICSKFLTLLPLYQHIWPASAHLSCKYSRACLRNMVLEPLQQKAIYISLGFLCVFLFRCISSWRFKDTSSWVFNFRIFSRRALYLPGLINN